VDAGKRAAPAASSAFRSLIFLGVAAFILNIALVRPCRCSAPSRAQAANCCCDLGWHYVKWGLAIAAVGALAGVAAGVARLRDDQPL
jgi:hypothetical protein